MSNLCPVCRNPSQITYSSVSGGYSIECPRCGHYFTNDIDIDDFHNALGQDWVKLSGFLCNNKRFILKYSNFKELISKTRMPTPSEKADNILLYLGEKFKTPGTMIDLTSDSSKIIPKIEGLGYIENFDEEKYLLRDYLEKEKGLLRYKPNCLIITPKGWDYISKLLKPNQNSNTAFIAMWFSPKVEGTRKSIKQAIRDAGYEPKIVNEEPFNGDIVNQIITFINQSRFVVADLTEQRQGVILKPDTQKD